VAAVAGMAKIHNLCKILGLNKVLVCTCFRPKVWGKVDCKERGLKRVGLGLRAYRYDKQYK